MKRNLLPLPPRLLAALACLAASACADPCANTAVKELPSPDGRFVATAFVRDCGATTGHGPQVYLRRPGEPSGAAGNVFRGNRSERVEIGWRSARELVVKSDCEVIRVEENYDGVRVVFERMPAAAP